MRIKISAQTFAIAAAMVVPLLGTAAAEPLTTSGIGLASCEKLAKDMKPAEGLQNQANVLLYFWVQGYMSAANITTLEDTSVYVDLSKFDETVILPLVYDFCSKNPTKKPIGVIDDLLSRTPKEKGTWTKGTVPWAAN